MCDSVGRNTQVTEQIAGASYVTNSIWDSKNRLDVLTYPGPSNRLALKHSYNAQGYNRDKQRDPEMHQTGRASSGISGSRFTSVLMSIPV